jgi:translocator protein
VTLVSNRSHPRLSTLAATTLAVAAAAGIGSIASPRRAPSWYSRLRKPSYQPPGAAFPVVWTILYGDIACSSAAAIDRFRTAGRHDEARRYIGALSVNLLLNAGWSWLFFRNHKLGTSALGAAALTVSSADLARRTAHAHPRAGLALLPYPLWCAFATVLSTDIWQLNRRSE